MAVASGGTAIGFESRTFYKVVARVEGRLLSIFDGITEYAIGRVLRQEVRERHRGGLYVARSPQDAVRATFNLPTQSKLLLAPRVLLRCQARGPLLEYGQGKVAVSALLPMEARALDSATCATYSGRCRAARRPRQSSQASRLASEGPGRLSLLLSHVPSGPIADPDSGQVSSRPRQSSTSEGLGGLSLLLSHVPSDPLAASVPRPLARSPADPEAEAMRIVGAVAEAAADAALRGGSSLMMGSSMSLFRLGT